MASPTRIKGLFEAFNKALDMDAAWEGVKRLGLKADNTAADRAKALGFDDKTYYHGTDASFNKFDNSKLHNGVVGGVGSKDSHWFADSSKVSNTYADYIPKQRLLARQQGLLSKYNKGNMPINEWIDFNNKLNKTVGQGSQIYPVKIKKGQGQSYDMAGESYKDNDGFIMDYMESKLEKAKSFKDDTTTFTSLDDHVLKGSNIAPSTHVSVRNPANIRSKFARFNPRLAGVGAGSILSADLLAEPSGKPEFREAPMGLLDKAKKYAADSYEYAADEGGILGEFLYGGGAKALRHIEKGTTPMVKTGRLPAMPTGAALANLLELLQL